MSTKGRNYFLFPKRKVARHLYSPRLPISPPHFKAETQLVLRDRVRTRKSESIKYDCIPSMTEMFQCLKENEFNETKCENAIKHFKNCYNSFQKKRQEFKINKNSPNFQMKQFSSNKYPANLVNQMLDRYKTPLIRD
ncbi:hypothetical protein SNEBB_000144 [Seison nebaliae]|nr:hypothetical protein SNEBB_000144 [Seison nebaliae]